MPDSHQNETGLSQIRDKVTVQTVWQNKTCLLRSPVAGTGPGPERGSCFAACIGNPQETKQDRNFKAALHVAGTAGATRH